MKEVCSICGEIGIDFPTHRCPEATLRAINAANTRAWNEHDSEIFKEHFAARPFGSRLHEAFSMIRQENE